MTKKQTQLVVIGSGPGGYSAAFRAADLGLSVILIERYEKLGGVCLNVGCIPSKALLHAAKVIDEAAYMSQNGIQFGAPKINAAELYTWKNNVVNKLCTGIKGMAKQRKVEVIQGVATFLSKNAIQVEMQDEKVEIQFEHAIIAAGSRPVSLPFIPADPRIIDSTGALELKDIKGSMLVIGGGIIGLEMATVYSALGAPITIVEWMDQLMPGADADIVKPLHKRIAKHYQNIYLKTKVTQVEAKKDGLYVTFEGEQAPKGPQKYDQILVAVGRVPNGKMLEADKAGVQVDERGFIPSDNQMRTNVPNVFSIGDIRGNPMLAHKAVPEGRLAAEVIAGKKYYSDARCIPSVAYTDPEVAWVGMTENEAIKAKVNYGKGVFPWAASGRSLSMGRDEGITKILFDNDSHRVIGAAIVGTHAGDLISEIALAIEMGCDAADLALTIHPHPTLSESIMVASELFEGTATDLYMPKKD
jgi:dihydrolipoamide dehydrogenase